MNQKRVAIIGAGFSGLTLARELKLKGFHVEVFEASPELGGVIQTHHKDAMIETAAHALLSSQSVEKLFQDLNLKMVHAGHQSKAKWIYRAQPKRWPLKLTESLRMFWGLLRKKSKPSAGQSLDTWVKKHLGPAVNDYLASPSLQGVYGAQTTDLSANLILGNLFSKDLRPAKAKVRGSVAPLNGMSELIHALAKDLTVHLNKRVSIEDLKSQFDAVILATSLKSATQLLKSQAPQLADHFSQIPSLTLTAATVVYQSMGERIKGFGCLFPNKENMNSLGVLFNTDIFENRGPLDSETWIFKGSPANIEEKIKADRQKLSPASAQIKSISIYSWPDVLPLYGAQLEKTLSSDLLGGTDISNTNYPCLNVLRLGAKVKESQTPLYLTGNYLGGLGLAKILDYNKRLSTRIQKDLKA